MSGGFGHCRIKGAIIDRDVHLPEATVIATTRTRTSGKPKEVLARDHPGFFCQIEKQIFI